MKYCVACQKKMVRETKFQISNKGYCTPCVKSSNFKKIFNHYSGEPVDEKAIFEYPEDLRKYHIKDVNYNVIVSFY